MSDKEITEQEINKILEENQHKLSDYEVDTISEEIINKKEWIHNINYSPKNFEKDKINVNENLYPDLEIFISYNHDKNDTVYKQINFTKTKLGDFYYQQLLSNPTKKTDILLNRQKLIKKLLSEPQKLEKINSLLNTLNQCQHEGLWMWKQKTPEFDQIFQILYFKNQYLQSFNTSEWFLKIYNYFQIIFIPLYGLIAPILFFIVPFIIVRFFFGVKIPIKLYYNIIKQTFFGGSISVSLFGNSKLVSIVQYAYQIVTFFLYGYGIYNSFKASYTLNKIINMIHQKVNNLAKFVKTSYELYQEAKTLFELEPLTVSYLELWDQLFEKEPYLLSDKGKILRTFFLLHNGKDKLIPLLQMVGFIDTITSITTLYNVHTKSYSFPVYLTNTQGPSLTCIEGWNPFLDSSKAIKNDFMIGDEKPNNILITGPNASGKSTFIKSVILGILMSQTISITPCTLMKITPFDLLNTYLNIPDAKGRESLFEAEMYRAKNHINSVNNLKNDQYSLVIMDEIFNSTNYEEGVAGAYTIAKELGNIKNSLTIITTHFNYLTKLDNTNNYVNYMFDVEKVGDQIIKSYKLKEGISKQYLALDLLEKNGYSSEMIQEARTIFQELVEITENKLGKTNIVNEIKEEIKEEIKDEIKEESKDEIIDLEEVEDKKEKEVKE